MGDVIDLKNKTESPWTLIPGGEKMHSAPETLAEAVRDMARGEVIPVGALIVLVTADNVWTFYRYGIPVDELETEVAGFVKHLRLLPDDPSTA